MPSPSRWPRAGTNLPAEIDVGAARSAFGERPAGAVVTTVRDTGTVNGVDQETNAVTFTSSRGVRPHRGGAQPEMQAFIRTLRPAPARECRLRRGDRDLGQPAESR